jgi:Ser/Thr protein kinase RdoA (MazF antagonist)
MRKNGNLKTSDLFAGIDHLSLDKRPFAPSRDDIQRICRFFSIGKLQHYEQEKGISVSHSNFFVFAATTQGHYALKFYPQNAAKTIAIEYAVNRILTDQHFPTPIMFTGLSRKPFLTSTNRLATCYAYIKGLEAWQVIKQRDTIGAINTAQLSLKEILALHAERIPFLKQKNLISTAKDLAQASKSTAPYAQKDTIETALKDACKTYQKHQPLFIRQCLHNNANLNNFLINKRIVYTLDLSHIREDYILSDLSSMVISCLFFNVPAATIKLIIKDYFIQHKIGPEQSLVLNTLIRIGLIREYLKNVQREKSDNLAGYPPDLMRAYLTHLSERKKSITTALQGLA